MDRAAWQATVNGVTRVGRDLAIVMLVMIVINYHHTKKKEKKIQINKIRNERESKYAQLYDNKLYNLGK